MKVWSQLHNIRINLLIWSFLHCYCKSSFPIKLLNYNGNEKNRTPVNSVSVFSWFRLRSARFFWKAFLKMNFQAVIKVSSTNSKKNKVFKNGNSLFLLVAFNECPFEVAGVHYSYFWIQKNLQFWMSHFELLSCPVAFFCAEANKRIKSTTQTVRQHNVTTKNEYIRTKHGVKNRKDCYKWRCYIQWLAWMWWNIWRKRVNFLLAPANLPAPFLAWQVILL